MLGTNWKRREFQKNHRHIFIEPNIFIPSNEYKKSCDNGDMTENKCQKSEIQFINIRKFNVSE